MKGGLLCGMKLLFGHINEMRVRKESRSNGEYETENTSLHYFDGFTCFTLSDRISKSGKRWEKYGNDGKRGF